MALVGFAYNNKKPCFRETPAYTYRQQVPGPSWWSAYTYVDTTSTCWWPGNQMYSPMSSVQARFANVITYSGADGGTHWFQTSMASSLEGCAEQCIDRGCDAFSYVPMGGPSCDGGSADLRRLSCELFVAPAAGGHSSWYTEPTSVGFSGSDTTCYQVIYARVRDGESTASASWASGESEPTASASWASGESEPTPSGESGSGPGNVDGGAEFPSMLIV